MPGYETPQNSRQPVLLLRNRRYPTYQLYATAGCGKAQPDAVLKIAILETLNWLRQRFRAFDLPAELDWPDASHYEAVDSKDFQTFLLNEGYKVEVAWLPDDKIWTLQLTEPDLGPQPGEEHQTRQPVPGRLYETNVAYRVVGDQVICGFRTIVAEPEGTTQTSEVYRLAIIKRLARNPLVGLKQDWLITDAPHPLDTVGAIHHLQTWLRDHDRMLPAVIAVECTPQPMAIDQLPSLKDMLPKPSQPRLPLIDRLNPLISQMQPTGGYSINFSELAHHKMGYAIFFTLPLIHLESFRKITQIPAAPGEIFICEPVEFKGENKLQYAPPASNIAADHLQKQLDQLISEYPKHKLMRFGATVFLAQARVRYQELLVSMSHSKEDVLKAVQRADEARSLRRKEELAAKQEEIRLRDEKIKRLNEKINRLDEAICAHQIELDALEQQHQTALSQREAENAHLQALLCRPKHPIDVEAWVRSCFASRLIFHARASNLMSNLAPNDVDLPLVCDALEFLATEYRDTLLGRIDETEMNDCCSRKYSRPFVVQPISDKTIEQFSSDYKIKYYTGNKEKLVESPLDLHLKVGNAADNLLRIYFLYDTEKKLIVVGSLPRHLKTDSYH